MMAESSSYGEIFEHKTVQVTKHGTITYTLVSSSKTNGHNHGLLAPEDGNALPALETVMEPEVEDSGKGLTKQRLHQRYSQGRWRQLRIALLVLFWLSVLGLIAACVYLVARERTCQGPDEPYAESWWKKTVLYQLNIKTFQDSDNDGIGDIQGLISRLDYIKETLGLQVIVLNSILQGPNGNNFAVANFYNIDPAVGTLTDFKDLLDQMHGRNMSLVMDIPVSSTSQQHPWFLSSQLSTVATPPEMGTSFRDFYVWHSGYWDAAVTQAGRDFSTPPSLQKTKFGGRTVWGWMPSRQQYFSSYLSGEQADLNYESESLRQAMDNVLRFWLHQGIDGFRLLNVENIVSPTGSPLVNASMDAALTSIPTPIVSLLYRWRRVLDDARSGNRKVLMVDGDGLEALSGLIAVDLLLNRRLMQWNSTTPNPGLEVARFVQQSLHNADGSANPSPNWAVGNFDAHRMASRVGSLELVDALNMLHLLLPGTAVAYHGDELGMLDGPHGTHLSASDARFLSHGPQVSPMLWSNQLNAGFTNASHGPWLPINDRYRLNNVQQQLRAGHSTLKVFQKLVELKKHESALHSGTFRQVMVGESVYAFVRQSRTEGTGFLVVLDLRKPRGQLEGTESNREYSLSSAALHGWGRMIVQSVNLHRRHKQANLNQTVDLRTTLTLRPSEAVVIQFYNVHNL
ncbi:alpha-glucosidase [Ramazzottius varieornatus]|uniref:alpha-glucosidase n=1 Tax=Ramazzottius varieornatus TaxID=947166 RepID=A0A1D1VTB3_RAMVA|nr:alpha-glucosidase [Ramazzottius varieornatus]